MKMTDFKTLAKKYEEQLIADRRWLHENAEVGMILPRTENYIRTQLEEMGYSPEPWLESGLSVTVGRGENLTLEGEPKCILLRADIDALPIHEEADLPFAAKGEAGHLCGHDIHGAVALTVARILKECEEEISGLVKIVFQPGEEQSNGAEHMVKAGVMQNPQVHACLGMHVKPNAENGSVHYALGPATAAIDFFKIDIEGKTAHSSQPEQAKDPLQAAMGIYHSLEGMVRRELSAFRTAVVAVGIMEAGSAPNSIPTNAHMEGTLRSYSNEDQAHLRECMRLIVAQHCALAGVAGSINFVWTPVTENNTEICNHMGGIFDKYVGKENVIIDKQPVASSDDFAFFAQEAPSMLFWFGVGSDEGYAIHDPRVVMEEDKLYLAAAAIAEGAVSWCSK